MLEARSLTKSPKVTFVVNIAVKVLSHAPSNGLTETAGKRENSTGMKEKREAALLTADFDVKMTEMRANMGKIAWKVEGVRARHI